jgi:hypothetical protein
MGTPPAEELLRKIQDLEAGQADLRQEMSKLKLSGDAKSEQQQAHHQRSHSVSPQRSNLATSAPRRRGGAAGLDAGTGAWKKGSASFRHSSPLQRESRSREPVNVRIGGGGGGGGGPSAVNFTDRQYLNILQSMGQSVHIFDLNGRIIYWLVVQSSSTRFFFFFFLKLLMLLLLVYAFGYCLMLMVIQFIGGQLT